MSDMKIVATATGSRDQETTPRKKDFTDPSLYINRELSWIEFNARVLGEAEDPEKPLLERLKFLSIVASNLDEFFMVRVAGVKQQIASGTTQTGPDGLTPEVLFRRISLACHEQIQAQYRCLLEEVLPALEAHDVFVYRVSDLPPAEYQWADEFYHRQVFPVLTPLAIDSGHPFPKLRSTSLNLAVRLRNTKLRHRPTYFAVVQVPQGLDRFVRLPMEGYRFILLEDLIMEHVDEMFQGFEIIDCHPFYVLRDHDLEIDEEEGEDLLETIEGEIRKREASAVVRLDVTTECPADVLDPLAAALDLSEEDVYRVPRMMRLRDLMGLVKQVDLPELRDPPFVPYTVLRARRSRDLFKTIREGDILLHHPYESFDTVIKFLQQAAADPDVLAIKQTLYRTDGDSAIIRALEQAAEAGKQVTALVELKARFDELANIAWARRLEEAGVHVVYGLVGLKTHCKVLLVVRKEAGEDRLRRYVHLSTGNYNSTTARLYTDLGFLTCDLSFGRDASRLFNVLTGYSEFPQWRRFSVAPLGLKERTLELIRREQEHAENGGKGRIIAKINSLVDGQVIRALYAASCAGVEIDLIVRGICCLRPGIPGVSENIRVRSIVGRFLEHSRIFYFANDGNEEVYLSSADWMPRNLVRRVEVMFPIESAPLRQRLIDILNLSLADNTQARIMQPDGTYVWEKAPIEERCDSQAEFLRRAAEEHGIDPMRPFSADFFLRQAQEREYVSYPTVSKNR